MNPLGLTLLAETGRRHPDYGIIAAGTNNCGNPNQRFKTVDALRRETLRVAFICVYISRHCLGQVGYMDERYVDYGYDDDDYCLRVRNAGYKIGIYDGCKINHLGLPSVFRNRGANCAANLARFREKWGREGKEYYEVGFEE